MRRRRISRNRPGPRRKLVWGRSIRITPTVLTLATPNLVNLLDDFETQIGAQLLGATIMRIRGIIHFHWTSINSTNQAQAAWGALVANPETTSTATMDPLGVTSKYNDWMGYGAKPSYPFEGAPAAAGVFTNNTIFDVDVKSRRRLDELNEELIGAFTYNGDAAPTVQVSHNLSILVALP